MLRKLPCCANCDFYDPDETVEVYKTVECHSVGTFIGSSIHSGTTKVKEKGACKLNPHTTPHKKPDDWCGQHSTITLRCMKCNG